MYERRQRVAELLKQELSDLIRTLKNPKLAALLTITGLELARDMKTVRVFYSILGTEEEKKSTAKILDRSTGYLYHRLKERLPMKVIPFPEFKYDNTPAQAQRIEEILSRIREEDPQKPSSSP